MVGLSAANQQVRKRFRRSDWLDLGLAALGEAGPSGLTIDALCARAKKTRGSFYAHFESVEEFLTALAGHWRQLFTRALIEEADTRPRAGARLDHLNQLAVRLDARIEQGMRKLAAIEPQVAAVCAEVDQQRTDYLARLYQQTEKFSTGDALTLARIEYGAFVGLQQTMPNATPSQLRALYQGFLRLTGRS